MNCLVEVGRTLGIGRGVCRVEADQDRPGIAGFAETRGFHTGVLVDFAVAFECFTVAFLLVSRKPVDFTRVCSWILQWHSSALQ
jgi:hypothetical protein